MVKFGDLFGVEVTLHFALTLLISSHSEESLASAAATCVVATVWGNATPKSGRKKTWKKAASIHIRCWVWLDAFGLPASCFSMLHPLSGRFTLPPCAGVSLGRFFLMSQMSGSVFDPQL